MITNRQRPLQHGHGATSPFSMSFGAWKEVILRSWSEAGADNVGIVAAGVAFYGFLALVPLLGAIVLIYGLVANAKTVIHDMQGLTSVMPADAAKLIGEQLLNVVKTSGSKKGFGLLLALGLALFGARSAAGSVITALNIAYEEKERRSFLVVNFLALGITAVAACVAVLAVVAIAALGHLAALLPFAPGVVLVLGKLVSYIVFALGAAAAAATLYRYGPSRADPRWVWLTPGSLFAAVLWVALTLGFGIYVSKIGNYNATYGSLGAVVVLLTWMYLSSYVLLFGAEINSAVEDESTGQSGSDATAAPDHQSEPGEKHVAVEGTKADSAGPLLVTRRLPCEGTITQTPIIQTRFTQSWTTNLAIARGGLRMARDARLKDFGKVSSECAALGLLLMRKPGRLPQGLGFVAAAVALAMVARDLELKNGDQPSSAKPARWRWPSRH